MSAKKTKNDPQNTTQKTQVSATQKPGVNSGSPNGLSVPAPLMVERERENEEDGIETDKQNIYLIICYRYFFKVFCPYYTG